jgi:UTP--glucose-1-phosphate uridylyltransferase
MVKAYENTGGCMLAVREVPLDETKRYGIIDPADERDGLIGVKGIVEKPQPHLAPSRMAVIGRYILPPQVFDELDRHERGAGGEIQLTDALARLVGHHPFHGFRFEGQRFDCGDKVGFLQANIVVGLSRPDTAGPLREILKSLKI